MCIGNTSFEARTSYWGVLTPVAALGIRIPIHKHLDNYIEFHQSAFYQPRAIPGLAKPAARICTLYFFFRDPPISGGFLGIGDEGFAASPCLSFYYRIWQNPPLKENVWLRCWTLTSWALSNTNRSRLGIPRVKDFYRLTDIIHF